MNKILKNILASKRLAALKAKRAELIAKKEATRKMAISLGEAETMRKKIDRRLRRVESFLFRAGEISTLRFETALA